MIKTILVIQLLLLLCLPIQSYNYGYGQMMWPKVLQFLSQHKDLQQFTQLIRDNEVVRKLLTYQELTLLAPTDAAFDAYRGRLDKQLVLYHMIPVAMTVEALEDRANDRRYIETIVEEFPYLWPWKSALPELSYDADAVERLFINDAMMVDNETNYETRTRDDRYGKAQIVHKINKVLSPMATTTSSPSAYHFISQTNLWHLIPYAFNNFYKRVIATNSVNLYKDLSQDFLNHNQGYTYLIPADEYRSNTQDSEINSNIIRCSIVKKVVFLNAASINKNFETLNPNCYLTVISPTLINIRDTLYSHSKTIQVLRGNIPLKNGVAHVVKHVPGLFRPRLQPVFPFRSLWEHINNDWRLQIATKLMELSNNGIIQEIMENKMSNFTLFLVDDSKWEAFVKHNGKTITDLEKHSHLQTLMLRHATNGFYDIARLVDVSSTSLRGETLFLGSGNDKIIVKFMENKDGDIQIFWGTKTINVVRSNILCSNGIIHIIDSPFIFDKEVHDEALTLVKLWTVISKFIY